MQSPSENYNSDLTPKLHDLVKQKFSSLIIESKINLGDLVVNIESRKLLDFCKLLKLDSDLKFNMLVSLTAVDWLDQAAERFEVVYHLMSLGFGYRIRIKTFLSELNPEIESLTCLWKGANFQEREVWDMFGIRFVNHPDLRRILMYEEFKGHPLRKDYPLQGKQPRVKLIHPEVENTARNMHRQELVQISKNRSRL